MITLLDYGAGNVRSVRNAIKKLGFEIKDAASADDINQADKLIFPGVGSFGSAMTRLRELGYIDALRNYLLADRPFLGICLGLHTLFSGSEESPGIEGLGIIPGAVGRFDLNLAPLAVPHIGWNGIQRRKDSVIFDNYESEKLYFVHSYRAVETEANHDWILTTTSYGEEFISSINRGNVCATQFHPEKSGAAGLKILHNFLAADKVLELSSKPTAADNRTRLAKRIIACLDVRSNDNGDLIVTKGDQYDVRNEGEVRNLGKPVELARRYFNEGADEITFLNITGFRDFPLKDQPMLEVLKRTSEQVFVPLTIGGGIRNFTDSQGRDYSALDVASEYFRSGADKISIGSDAVYTAEKYRRLGRHDNAISQISERYGSQAVVISIDPRRIYVKNEAEAMDHHVIKTTQPGPNGEEYCWYQCTVKGGREGCDLDALTLAQICEKLGAGEILLNCIDRDGTNMGFDLELINLVRDNVGIPVIASSGAGCPAHFAEVFAGTRAEAALAAGIFHRREVPISEVKDYLARNGVEIRKQ
ncbi:imidazole glycerol phosphate synthase subunit HisF [Desulfobacterota bacterium M19]